MEEIEIAIIGGGPAGIAAGIQLKRYGLHPVIFEKYKIGGLLHNANLVENYLGFPEGLSGKELVRKIEAQIERFSLKIKYQEVSCLDYNNDFVIETSGCEYKAKIVIIASGTKPIKDEHIEIPESIQNRVLFEIDSILNVKDRDIAIIGAGDAAFDYAVNLGRYNRVTIFSRSSRAKCLPLLYERAKSNFNISYIESAAVRNINKSINSTIFLDYSHMDNLQQKTVDYVVFAIGRKPRLDFLSENVIRLRRELEDEGLLYLVGDVVNSKFRQASIAAGDGVKAAMVIYAKLKEARK